MPWIGGDGLLDEIEEFLTGTRGAGDVDVALATVLFTDIAGSTARLVSAGDSRWRKQLDLHDSITRRTVDTFGGKVVKSTGDGVLETFERPGRAIEAARAIVDGVRAAGVEVRAGLHTGEVERRGDDVGGLTVHIGARIASLASANEVLVSRTVKDLVLGAGLSFEERGSHELKGVPGAWEVFGVG